jgi:sporulation protein YlmC with PRC-barrel domain
MLGRLLMTSALGLTLAGGVAFAQTTTTHPAAATDTAATDTTPANGTLTRSHDDWRGSKLIGQYVYDDHGRSIGTVDDVLIGNDGRIGAAVVSVGGFLGMDKKLVRVPFDKLKFARDESRTSRGAADTTPTTPAPASTASTTAPAPAPATANPPPARYVDYSVVLPGATADSLKSMPDFSY